jgi:hypothetical protein
MKTIYSIITGIILVGLSPTASAFVYSQNFDGMGTTGTTPPAGWSMWIIEGSSTSLVIPTGAEMATALPGDPPDLVVWNQTEASAEWFAQAGNMGSSPTDANRLLGTSPNNTRGSILQLSLVNNSGAAISSVNLEYDMKSMANGTLKSGFPLDSTDELPGYRFYFLDGSTWVHFNSLDLSNDTLNSVGHAGATISYSTPVADGGILEFRWFDDNASAFAPDTMYAIDNVLIPEPTTFSLLAVGALALISLRRKA